MWHDLLAAVALMLVLEGILPFVNPAGFRRALLSAAGLEESLLRKIGLACMVGGVLMLYAVR